MTKKATPKKAQKQPKPSAEGTEPKPSKAEPVAKEETPAFSKDKLFSVKMPIEFTLLFYAESVDAAREKARKYAEHLQVVTQLRLAIPYEPSIKEINDDNKVENNG